MTPYEIAESFGFEPDSPEYKAVLSLSCGDFESATTECMEALALSKSQEGAVLDRNQAEALAAWARREVGLDIAMEVAQAVRAQLDSGQQDKAIMVEGWRLIPPVGAEIRDFTGHAPGGHPTVTVKTTAGVVCVVTVQGRRRP